MAHRTLRRTMTPIASALALALAFGGISAITAPAATAAASPAFDCTEPRFFAQAENPVGTLQLSTGSYNTQGNSVWTALGSKQTGTNIYNALAFNPADEYLYGTRYGSGTGVPGSFVRIDRDGEITHLGLASPDLGSGYSTLWDSGEFDSAGNYYVTSGNSGASSIRKISGLKDVTGTGSTPRPALSTVTLSSSARFADFTFKDGFLWAPNYGQSSTIYRIDVNGVLGTAGAVTSFAVQPTVMPSNSYGSAFTMTNGNLAFIATDGFMYQISVANPASTTPTFQLVSKVGAPTNARSDATNCATAQTSSLSVTKTGPVKIGVGQNITWEVTVTNDGPGITSGFVLTDTLPAGLTNTTVTSTDTSCVLNTGKTVATCNGGRLAVGATSTVTVSATAPMTPGPLANQAYAVGNEDPSPDAPTIANTQVELATQSDVPVTLPASGVVGFDSPTPTAEGGTTTYSGGAFTYTPPAGFSGNDTFVYSTASGSVTVYVVVNPIAAAGLDTSTYVDVPVTIDPDTLLDNSVGTGLELTSVGNAVNGSVSIVAGSPVFVPTPGFSGNASFTFTLTDDDGLTATESYAVRVLPTAGPVTTTVATNSSVMVTTATLLAATAGTGGTITAVAAPTGGSVAVVAGGYRFTPAANTSGTGSFSYTVTDGAGRTATNTVSITITPIAANDSKSTPAGTPVTVTVLANDAGTGIEVSDVSTPSSGSAAISAGAIVYTPEDDFSGIATFTYEITDDAGRTATATVTVTVSPVAAPASKTTPVNTSLTVPASELVGAGTGTGLTLTSAGSATNGSVSLISGNPVFVPTIGYSGDASFEYTVTDGAGSTSTATVSVTVTPTAGNRSTTTPTGTAVTITGSTLVGAGTGTGLELTSVGSAVNGTVALVDGDAVFTPTTGFSGSASYTFTLTDNDGGTATATVAVTVTPKAADRATSTPVNTPVTVTAATLIAAGTGTDLALTSVSGATNGTVALVGGNAVFTPTTGFSGDASYTYTLTGDGGTASATVTVTVSPIAADRATTTVTGTAVTTTAATLITAGTGTDLGLTSVGGATNGTVALVGGNAVFTPTTGFSGDASYTFTLEDDDGGTATATMAVTVTPLAANRTTSTPANTAVTVTAATLQAAGTGTGLELTGVGSPVNGTVALVSGNAVFTPTTDFSGTGSFSFTLTDDDGGTATATVTVTVTPRAVDDSVSTPLNTAATLNVLTNDIGTGLTITSHAAALHGTVTIAANGDLAYTPTAKYSGLDTVTYALSGAGGTDSATVSILVTPLAPDDVAVTHAGTAIDIDVLANDGGTGLVITGTGTPSARGTVTFTATGVRYTPAAGFSGIETFTYTAQDAAGTSVTATVTVSVRPLAAPSVAKGAAGRSFTFDVSGSGTGTGLVVTSVTPPKNGTAVINPHGTITFTPRAGFSGVEVITYTFTDSSGLTATGTVSVTIAPGAASSVSALPFMGTEPGMLVGLAGALLALGGLGLGVRMLRRRAE